VVVPLEMLHGNGILTEHRVGVDVTWRVTFRPFSGLDLPPCEDTAVTRTRIMVEFVEKQAHRRRNNKVNHSTMDILNYHFLNPSSKDDVSSVCSLICSYLL
jgi:hypothetical protein